MCALQLEAYKYDGREKMAERLALAAGFSAACIGILDCSKRTLVDAWIGRGESNSSLTHAQVLDVVTRALKTSLALQPPEPAQTLSDEGETWLWSRRYLIGIGERVGNLAPVTALVSSRGRQEISAKQQSLAHIGLTYAEQLRQERFGINGTNERSRIPEIILRSLSFGFAVTDATGTISYVTDLAKAWLERENDLQISNDRLCAVAQNNQQMLLEALARATGPLQKTSVVHLGGSDERPRTIVVLPMGRAPTLALVVFGQARGDGILPERLLTALGLTVAERRLALQLLAGKSLAAAAEDNNVTIATARSYLKRIFIKTGVHRQSQLIALYHTLIPPVLTTAEQPAPAPDQ